jgi:hypothetical protein
MHTYRISLKHVQQTKTVFKRLVFFLEKKKKDQIAGGATNVCQLLLLIMSLFLEI